MGFFIDLIKQRKEVERQGGMQVKYSELIQLMLSDDSRMHIIQTSGTMVVIGASALGGSTVFSLIQTFGKLTVEMKVKSVVFGSIRKEWVFHEFMDQSEMYQKMCLDIREIGMSKLLNDN